ncbi:MAG: alpha-amylase family glycosyl hydrolase, partial [Clostridia bacterium]|nr:alpha-amylase family glycosyl hydrolase [Clostridia bacterium]
MSHNSKLKKGLKRTAAVSLAALMTAGCVDATLISASAATSNSSILSDNDRGVIFANSRTDFRDESIYFLITTRFYDGDPSNNARTSEDKKAQNPENDPSWRGDFKGLIDKLDYIKALGFTAIWITPVVQNDSGYDYHGYHAYDFSAVDYRYESNGVTYQDLIDAVHAKGMKIIQDVVLNHTCNWGEKNLLQIDDPVYAGGRSDYVMPAGKSKDPESIYHHNGFCGGPDFDVYEAQNKTIADDCFDLETENPKVYNYLVDCYNKYIEMGVDGFRVDTVKHISRLTLNSVFMPAFKKTGGDNFYMFGEVCTKGHDVWYRDHPPISTCFYTWAEDGKWANCWTNDLATNESLVEEHYTAHCDKSSQPTSDNAFLRGNEYHTPDYSQKSGMDVIDFQMHWSFMNANNAFNTALGQDRYFNDSTWNVVYVDSHDYAPDECQTQRYTGGTDAWAENMSLMFTFRGIPCIYYGSEIEFQKGKPIDVGPNTQLANTGRAYYGDNIEGTITASDFTVFGNVSGTVADTLQQPLSQHLMRLNRIRQAIPALRKGQYSTEGCSGNIAFKRRYTDDKTDSFACVAISGNATFSGVPNGKYVDAVTGDVQNVTNGTLSASVSGKGNMKVYVLDTAKTPAPGRVIPNGIYLTDGGANQPITGGQIEIVNPTAITLDKTSVTVKEATTASVKATVAPDNATNKSVSWTTSDASVATVAGGTITGVSKGTATITAKTVNGLTATVKVTVTENADIVKPTGIKLDKTSLTLTEGDSDTLTATVQPTNATNKTVTWTSSDTAIATVDSSGNVKAVSEGTATITAQTFNGYKATATITVEPKQITQIKGIYFEKPSNWYSTVNVYFFSNNQTVGKAWPGTAMTDLGGGVYGYEYETTDSNLMIVFNDGSGNQTPDLKYVQNGYYNVSGYVKTIEPITKGTVIVTYVDTDGNVLDTEKLTGNVGTDYMTSEKTFDGYTIETIPYNAVGAFTESTITVTYIYKSNETPVTPLVNTSTIGAKTISLGSSVTLKGSATGGTTPYKYAYCYKKTSDSSWKTAKDWSTATYVSIKPDSTTTYNVCIKVQDSNGTVAKKYFDVNVTSALANNSTVSATSVSLGSSVTLKGAATGGTSPYKYAYFY